VVLALVALDIVNILAIDSLALAVTVLALFLAEAPLPPLRPTLVPPRECPFS